MEKLENKTFEEVKQALINDINLRNEQGIIEKTNADLIIKLINNAEDINEAITIAELGTTYKRTGFHFVKKLEKMSSNIKYLKKNEDLSFDNGGIHHKLIIGDNYDALQQLLISYKNTINIAYIDPPYASNSLGQFAETNYDNAITRDNLLSMLYPRLLLARELLSNDGVIFCSIDDKNQAYVKGLFDEIFSETNFIACLPRVTKKAGKQHADAVSLNHDYLLVYCKNSSQALFKGIVGVSSGFDNEDEFVSERGKYKLNQCLDYDTLWYNPTMDFAIEFEGKTFYPGGDYEKHLLRHSGIHNPKDWVWRWSKNKFDFGVENGFVVVKQGRDRPRIYTKTYENASIEKNDKGEYFVKIIERENNLSSVELIENKYSNDNGKKELDNIFGNAIFDNPKPSELIKILCEIVDNENAIVIDFFAGSGTTGQSVLQKNQEDDGNRMYILCTNNEITKTTPNGIAYDVTSKRMKRVMTGECYDGTKDFEWIKKNEPYGGSLDVYEIESVANFENTEGKTPFDVIDETNYGLEKFNNANDKIKWVCENFEKTQKYLEGE